MKLPHLINLDMAPLPSRDQRHSWLRYLVRGYGRDIIHSYEKRLKTIWGMSVNRVHVLDFSGLTEGMRQTLADRLCMVYTGMRGMSYSLVMRGEGLHTEEEMAEAGFGAYWQGSERVIPDKGDLRDYWMEISSDMDFLGPAPSYVFIQDPVKRLCHRMIACSISGRGQAPEKYLFRHAEGRKSGARLSRDHFIGRLAAHFGLNSDQGLRGVSVVTTPGLERQPYAAAGAPEATEDAPVADEGAQADPTPVQAPQPLPPAPRTIQQRVSRLEEEVQEL
ncbi:hypothetical protein Tco_0324192 [Tanacetum coccineum]